MDQLLQYQILSSSHKRNLKSALAGRRNTINKLSKHINILFKKKSSLQVNPKLYNNSSTFFTNSKSSNIYSLSSTRFFSEKNLSQSKNNFQSSFNYFSDKITNYNKTIENKGTMTEISRKKESPSYFKSKSVGEIKNVIKNHCNKNTFNKENKEKNLEEESNNSKINHPKKKMFVMNSFNQKKRKIPKFNFFDYSNTKSSKSNIKYILKSFNSNVHKYDYEYNSDNNSYSSKYLQKQITHTLSQLHTEKKMKNKKYLQKRNMYFLLRGEALTQEQSIYYNKCKRKKYPPYNPIEDINLLEAKKGDNKNIFGNNKFNKRNNLQRNIYFGYEKFNITYSLKNLVNNKKPLELNFLK